MSTQYHKIQTVYKRDPMTNYKTLLDGEFSLPEFEYLANNDWVAQNVNYFFGDWAEESLLQCERALYRLGEPRPAWLNASYYQEKIVTKA